ncbi:MAG TPA: hypothetical protein VKA70_14335 [Blastocatellia bacterium]|nr:hypothetical protein [Blastocatellia bacterium]
MKVLSRPFLKRVFAIFLIGCAASAAVAQEQPAVLSGAELTRVVPSSFYFEGQSAPTQMRNAAAARFGPKRLVIAGLVDTSGYSSEIRAKYEGFFITDSAIAVGGSDLGVGAYGFGFSNDGKFNLFDIAGNRLLSVDAAKDSALRRPRPLMMSKASDGLRLYAGRDYVTIAAR